MLSSDQERVVLETMNQTLYTEMGFRGNNDNYYDENNSFINKVRIFFSLCMHDHALLLVDFYCLYILLLLNYI